MKTYPHKVLIERDGKIVVQCNEEIEPDRYIAFEERKAKRYKDWESRHQFFEIADKENEERIEKLIYEEKQNLDGEYYNYHKFNKALKQGIDASEFCFIQDGKAFFKEPSSFKVDLTNTGEAEFTFPKPTEEKEEGQDDLFDEMLDIIEIDFNELPYSDVMELKQKFKIERR